MGDSADAAHASPSPRPGLITNVLTLPLRVFGVLCGSLLLSILLECVGVAWLWPQQGWHHAQGMLAFELDRLSSDFTRSLLLSDPISKATRLIEETFKRLTGVLEWAHSISARGGMHHSHFPNIHDYLNRFYAQVEPYALAIVYTVLTFLARLFVLCLTLPMFLTAAFVGLVDGLVQRDIRRFGAGHESGFLYHRVKATILPIAVMPWVVYLALPVSMHPVWILLPSAIAMCFALNLTAATFKKYL